MRRALCLLATLLCGSAWTESSNTAPSYSSASIVNSASNIPGPLAPNGLTTIYGTNLAWSTRAVGPEDISGGVMPTVLAGVRVYVGGNPAYLYYVSPKQINFLIPSRLKAGNYDVWVFREGLVGEKVSVQLSEAAPGLFQLDAETVIATHADGSVVTPAQPARPGEAIVVYAAGLGRTDPESIPGHLATIAAPIRARSALRVTLNGEPVADAAIFYAGVTPGFAGLYQINLRLPDAPPENPEIQVWVGDQSSAALKLPLVFP